MIGCYCEQCDDIYRFKVDFSKKEAKLILRALAVYGSEESLELRKDLKTIFKNQGLK